MALTSLPRMRGDRPWQGIATGPDGKFTPHARGSTLTLCSVVDMEHVYPTCAGIDHLHPGP